MGEPYPFQWTGREDDDYQVSAVCAHLQQHFAPPSVTVIGKPGIQWLEATFGDEKVEVAATKTDYVFLAEEAVDLYDLHHGMPGTLMVSPYLGVTVSKCILHAVVLHGMCIQCFCPVMPRSLETGVL